MLSSRHDPEYSNLPSPDKFQPPDGGTPNPHGLLVNATLGECHAVPRRF
ncbi:hypothetical protein SAMN06295955_11214 [Sphingopyxis indica]|uniref:Uncharacterized protein n=1 Tax=Sphingopyxis indica TaxID=436663 RepID=A0A239K0E0_9SPHN|nr:hypothetical protein SAMN06295955_11214 [Sphingopyxis indica]